MKTTFVDTDGLSLMAGSDGVQVHVYFHAQLKQNDVVKSHQTLCSIAQISHLQSVV